MPLSEAERAAQFNVELIRMKKSDGSANKPLKIWCNLNHIPKTISQQREKILRQEQSTSLQDSPPKMQNKPAFHSAAGVRGPSTVTLRPG
jgi:hypothetical protein